MIIENDLSYRKIPIKMIFEYNVLFVNRFLKGFVAHCTTTLVLKIRSKKYCKLHEHLRAHKAVSNINHFMVVLP